MTDCLAQTITNNPQSETVHKHCAALHSSKQTDVYLRPSTRGKDCSLFSPWTRLTVCLRPCWGSASTRRSQTPSWDPATSRHTTVIHTESWLRPITGRDRWCLCGSSSLRRLSRSSQGRPVQRRGGGATADSLICKSTLISWTVAVYQPDHDCKSSLTCVPFIASVPNGPFVFPSMLTACFLYTIAL